MRSRQATSNRQSFTLETLPTEDFLKLLGQKVRSCRKQAGITRRHLAKISGVSERYLANVELGVGNISIGLLKQVADALEIPINRFFIIDIPPSMAFSDEASQI